MSEVVGRFEGVRKSKYGKWKQARRVGRVWKSAEDGRSQIGSVGQVGRVSGKARTPRKRRLGSEETRHPMEDEGVERKAKEGAGNAGSLPEVARRLREEIGVSRRVWEGTGVRH